MISSYVLLTVALCAAFCVTMAENEGMKMNVTGEGHWWGPGWGWPGHHPPGFFPPFWGHWGHHRHHPQFFGFSFDHFYCSAHASFFLIGQHHHRFGHTGASFEGPEVGHHSPPHHRDHFRSRQFCRFTATVDQHTCVQCCQIAARHFTTSIDEVTGVLAVFDPTFSFFDGTGESYRKKRQSPPPPTDRRVPQCLCCAPRKHFGFYF